MGEGRLDNKRCVQAVVASEHNLNGRPKMAGGAEVSEPWAMGFGRGAWEVHAVDTPRALTGWTVDRRVGGGIVLPGEGGAEGEAAPMRLRAAITEWEREWSAGSEGCRELLPGGCFGAKGRAL